MARAVAQARLACALLIVLAANGHAAPRSPIVDGETVTFVAAGTPADPPRIVADFNGWEGGVMKPSPDGRRYTLQVRLDPAARIEYLIAYRNRFVLDPGNPLTIPSPAGPPRSELRMPRYQPPPPLAVPSRRGRVESLRLNDADAHRRVRVYVPADAAQALPVLYVHDGDIVLDALKLPAVLDAMIAARTMAPALVVFIDAVDRHADYEPGSLLRRVLTQTIVPTVERRYRVIPERRAIMGLSRSTVGAMDACTSSGMGFDACVLMAPAIAPRDLPRLLPRAGTRTRFLIETGTYDVPLVTDARALRRELDARHLVVEYAESPQGHNHTAFRSRLSDVMRRLFPVR